MKDIKKRNEAQRIAEQASRKKINPLEAAAALNALMDGLSGAVWNPGQNQFKIFGYDGVDVRICLDGLDNERMAELAALSYHRAQLNGSLDPGEIHLGPGASSRHHKEGFNRLLTELLAKYQPVAGGI